MRVSLSYLASILHDFSSIPLEQRGSRNGNRPLIISSKEDGFISMKAQGMEDTLTYNDVAAKLVPAAPRQETPNDIQHFEGKTVYLTISYGEDKICCKSDLDALGRPRKKVMLNGLVFVYCVLYLVSFWSRFFLASCNNSVDYSKRKELLQEKLRHCQIGECIDILK
jgi:hypothetical protein